MDAVQRFTLLITQEVDKIVIYIRGDLDFTVSPDLMTEIEKVFRYGTHTCVLDFERVTFVDSEVVKLLLDIRQRLLSQGVGFYLQNCNAQVDRVISILGLQRWLLNSTCEELLAT